MKITISGRCGEGKTTIAMLIEEALQAKGIKVRNLDVDVLYGSSYLEHQDKRLSVLADSRSEIEIETVQTRW